jgi:hypothetical protein
MAKLKFAGCSRPTTSEPSLLGVPATKCVIGRLLDYGILIARLKSLNAATGQGDNGNSMISNRGRVTDPAIEKFGATQGAHFKNKSKTASRCHRTSQRP